MIERDIRLFFQYKFLIIMRAIWFVSQIALFGLIASRMIDIPSRPFATGSIHLDPYQANTFQIYVPNSSFLSLDLLSSQGHGYVNVHLPNGTLIMSGNFSSSNNQFNPHYALNNTHFGMWSATFLADEVGDSYSFNAYNANMDYFRFYVSGLSVMTLYSAAIFIGFDIYEEAEHGVFEYLLSLPVSRRQLVLGRSIGGGLRAFIYVGPLIGVSLYVIGAFDPLNFLAALFSLFLFAFGVSGMSITIAVLIKSSDRFDILMGVLDALIVRLSTAMYPLAVVQKSSPFYGWLANFNPVTFVADLFRWGTGIESIITLNNPLLPLLGIIVFFAFFTFVGIIIYDKRIEGGGWQ